MFQRIIKTGYGAEESVALTLSTSGIWGDMADNMVQEIRKWQPVDVLRSYERTNFCASSEYRTLHPLIQSLVVCQKYGLPFVLSPNVILYRICQVLGSCHGVEMESVVVEFKQFEAHDPSNPWPVLFDSLSHILDKKVRKMPELRGVLETYRLDLCNSLEFLTSMSCFTDSPPSPPSPPVEEEINPCGTCGVPFYMLDGSIGEWEYVRDLCKALLRVDKARDWIGNVVTIVEEVLRAANVNESRRFWNQFFTAKVCENRLYVAGWISTLFPLDQGGSFKPFSRKKLRVASSLGYTGFVRAPLAWKVGSDIHHVNLYTGLVGAVKTVRQEVQYVECRFTWGLADQVPQMPGEDIENLYDIDEE